MRLFPFGDSQFITVRFITVTYERRGPIGQSRVTGRSYYDGDLVFDVCFYFHSINYILLLSPFELSDASLCPSSLLYQFHYSLLSSHVWCKCSMLLVSVVIDHGKSMDGGTIREIYTIE